MDITRREFLVYSTGAMAAARLPHPVPPSPPAEPPRLRQDRWRSFASYPEARHSESARGFDAALPIQRRRRVVGERDPVTSCSLLVLPDVRELGGRGRFALHALRHGSTVIVETGAGFARHLDFCKHRRSLRERLQIEVAAPVDLGAAERPAPYIDFTWPRRTKIRDFSRVVPPVDHPGDEVIAWAGDLAVAFRRRVAQGTLIYLGSPIGPALWTGDIEARRWLYAVALSA